MSLLTFGIVESQGAAELDGTSKCGTVMASTHAKPPPPMTTTTTATINIHTWNGRDTKIG